MGVSDLMESIDSLWFFNNVLSSSSRPQPMAHDDGAIGTNKSVPPNPTSPISRTQQPESPNAEPVTPRCPKCGEFAVEPQKVQPCVIEEAEVSKSIKNGEKQRRRRRRNKKSKRKLDMGFGGDDYYYKDCGFGAFDFGDEKCGYGTSTSQQQYHYQVQKMPPLNDGMAMKQHLKSWAYAVACTVK